MIIYENWKCLAYVCLAIAKIHHKYSINGVMRHVKRGRESKILHGMHALIVF